MKISNNKILITGGGSGIGLGLTERFIKDNNTVIICGRDQAKLKTVSEEFPNVITKMCDLSSKKERIELFKWIQENHPDLNVLINNAGIQQWMNISDDDFYQKTEQEIIINILTPIHLTTLFSKLKSLETIVNVTSGLAFIPFSKVPVYSGTKAFMRSFTMSLRHQMKPRNVEIVEIIPPALNTNLGGTGLHNGQPEVSDFIESVFQQLSEGKTELTFGFSKERTEDNNKTIQAYFEKLNP